jgi:hypothetical protein
MHSSTTDLILALCSDHRNMKAAESLLVPKETLGTIIRALELHPCRGALEQALDRLEKVQDYRDGKLDQLPNVAAAITLIRKRIEQDRAAPLDLREPPPPPTIRGQPWPRPGTKITWREYHEEDGFKGRDLVGQVERVDASLGFLLGAAATLEINPVTIHVREDSSGRVASLDALRCPWSAVDQTPGQEEVTVLMDWDDLERWRGPKRDDVQYTADGKPTAPEWPK